MKPYKKKKYKNKSQIVLTKEQNEFIETALLGTNIELTHSGECGLFFNIA